MPTIEVDVLFFIFTVIVAFISVPFIIGWSFWKAYKNPEFWLKLRKQGWVYQIVRTQLGEPRQVVVPLKRIGPKGEFRTMFGSFFWRDRDREGRSAIFTWRQEARRTL